MSRNATSILLAAFLAAALTGCLSGEAEGSATGSGEQKANAGMSAIQDRSASSEAERLYVEKCSMCHRDFGMGTTLLARRLPPDQAKLEARENLTADYVIMAARQGVGNMPPISRGEVSDQDMATIAAYIAREGQ